MSETSGVGHLVGSAGGALLGLELWLVNGCFFGSAFGLACFAVGGIVGAVVGDMVEREWVRWKKGKCGGVGDGVEDCN